MGPIAIRGNMVLRELVAGGLYEFKRRRIHAVTQSGRLGPSSNTCPRCEPHRAHVTSVPPPKLEWLAALTASPPIGCQKLGHPVPESYFASELNNGLPQAAQK